MVKLYEVVDEQGLREAIEAKHVKRQFHPSEPLAILNYSQICMFSKSWTPVTRACRGLIYNTQTMEIVARPFRKFFNHGEVEAGVPDLNARVIASDKMDGSLGVVYPLPSGGYAVATRGSFASEQALHATQLWNSRYADTALQSGVTYLFEIIFRENRIVLDYKGLDDLVFLAAIDIETGRTRHDVSWHGRCAEVFPFQTLAEALRATPRANAEGLVVLFVDSDDRQKFKQADYIALHGVLTGTSPRRLWEFLTVNACKLHIREMKHWQSVSLDPAVAERILAIGDEWKEKMLSGVPDEFFTWMRDTLAHLEQGVERVRAEVVAAWQALEHTTPLSAEVRTSEIAREERKAFSARVGAHPHAPGIFRLAEGKEIDTYLWKRAYPAADKGWMSRSEDVA